MSIFFNLHIKRYFTTSFVRSFDVYFYRRWILFEIIGLSPKIISCYCWMRWNWTKYNKQVTTYNFRCKNYVAKHFYLRDLNIQHFYSDSGRSTEMVVLCNICSLAESCIPFKAVAGVLKQVFKTRTELNFSIRKNLWKFTNSSRSNGD